VEGTQGDSSQNGKILFTGATEVNYEPHASTSWDMKLARPRKYQTCLCENGVGDQLLHNSTAFEPTSGIHCHLGSNPILKKYKTCAYFDRTARQNASKISAIERESG